MTCGIYKIENKINGKIYIGQAVDIKIRWKDHKSCGKNLKNRENHKPLYQAMYKYGLENFEFSIVEECSQKDLNDKEIYWIKEYNCIAPNGYNLTPGGNAPIIYDYQEIFDLWNEGFLCWEIEEIIGCNDKVIHKALINFGITQEEIISRYKQFKRKPVVAIDINTGLPLKEFNSIIEVKKYFNDNDNNNSRISSSIKNHWKVYGYYWAWLNENNKPNKILTDEEFLNFQGKFFHRTKEEKIILSLKNRKVERPSREELKNLIRNKSFTQIALDYKVTDNAIRKWCDFENLPKRKKDINAISDEDWELI